MPEEYAATARYAADSHYHDEVDVGSHQSCQKSDIYTNLSLQAKSTAQTLREAHILLMEKERDTMVFGLTNSILWSFAKATKYGVRSNM